MWDSKSLTQNSETVVDCDDHQSAVAGEHGAVVEAASPPRVRLPMDVDEHREQGGRVSQVGWKIEKLNFSEVWKILIWYLLH